MGLIGIDTGSDLAAGSLTVPQFISRVMLATSDPGQSEFVATPNQSSAHMGTFEQIGRWSDWFGFLPS